MYLRTYLRAYINTWVYTYTSLYTWYIYLPLYLIYTLITPEIYPKRPLFRHLLFPQISAVLDHQKIKHIVVTKIDKNPSHSFLHVCRRPLPIWESADGWDSGKFWYQRICSAIYFSDTFRMRISKNLYATKNLHTAGTRIQTSVREKCRWVEQNSGRFRFIYAPEGCLLK